MVRHAVSDTTAGRVSPESGTILLVESDPELRESRRLLLSILHHPVLAVSTYVEFCKLPADSSCRLVAVDLSPSEREAQLTAVHARQTWPAAKILLLGRPSDEFDDFLYDDSVCPTYNPSGIVETVERLLKGDR
jgi:hypothetical protein